MITTLGKTHIKRYMAGWTPAIAQSIAFGLGTRAEAVGDTELEFEVGRSDIILTSYDFINNKLVFKAQVPDNFAGTINEVALYSLRANTVAGEASSRLISTFDSETETWLNAAGTAATFSNVNSRIGIDALRVAPDASTTTYASMSNLVLDLQAYSAADEFSFAYYAGANVASVQFRFSTDASNYYSFTINSPGTGYNVTKLTKGAAVVTGVPTWENITSISAHVTAGAGGIGTVDFDGIRLEDKDTVNPDYIMVSRELLPTPFIKNIGMTQEIEFTMDVAV